MVRLSASVVVLIALALIVSSVQCAAACTPVSCGHPPPPCHHHKQAPANQKAAGCAHELVPATIQSSNVSVLFSSDASSESMDTRFTAGALVSLDIPPVQNQSPPGLTILLPSVLRI